MAETKVINLEVKDNLKKTNKKVKDLNKDLKSSEKAVKDTSKASEELGKTTNAVTGGMIGKFKGLLGSLKSVITSFGVLKTAIIATGIGALLIAIVSIKKAFTSSEEGQNKYAKLMGVLGSIMANLTDILSEIGDLLIWVFTHPQEALKKFVKLVKENVINRFTGLLELIPNLGKAISKLFSGDFKGAAKTAADAVGKVALGMDSVTDSINKATEATKEFIEEQLREAKIASEIADSRAKADKIERKLIVERAEANRKIVQLRDKAIQKDLFSLDERLQALKDAVKIETEITNKEIKAAELRYKAKVAENALSKSTKEDLEEEANLKAKIINLETSKAQTIKRINTELVSARNEQRALDKAEFNEKQKIINEQAKAEKQANDKAIKEAKEKAKKELEIEKKRLQNLQSLENDFLDQLEQAENDYFDSKLSAEQLEIQKTQDKYFTLIENAKQYGQDATTLELAQKEELAKINDKYRTDEIAKDKALKEAKINAVSSTLSTIGNLAELFAGKSRKQQEKAFKVQKAVNIASALIDTYKAANLALASAPPPISFITAAASVAAGLLNVKKIASQQFNASGDGGSVSGGGSTPSFSTPQSVQPSFNVVGDSGVNQLEALKSQPSKAYVVSGEVTTQQALDRNRQRNATL